MKDRFLFKYFEIIGGFPLITYFALNCRQFYDAQNKLLVT